MGFRMTRGRSLDNQMDQEASDDPRRERLEAWVTDMAQDDALKAQVAADADRVAAGLAPDGIEVDVGARTRELRQQLDGRR